MEPISIERSIWINAPRERVWHAITDPKQVEAWFSPGTQWEYTRLELGGRLFHRNPETGEEMYAQVVDVLDPPNELATRADSDKPSVTTYTLVEENGGTRLLFRYSGYEWMDEATRKERLNQDSMGFDLMLGNIQALIEGRPLPNPGGF